MTTAIDRLRYRAAERLWRSETGASYPLLFSGSQQFSSCYSRVNPIVDALLPRVDSVQSYFDQPIGAKMVNSDTGAIVEREDHGDNEREDKDARRAVTQALGGGLYYVVWSPANG